MAQAVRDQDRRIFQQLFGTAKQAVFAYSARTLEILDANDAAVALFGSSRRKLIGSNLAAHAKSGEAVKARRHLVSTASDEMRSFAFDARKADGSPLRLRGMVTPIAYGGKNADLVTIGPPSATKGVNARGAALRRFDAAQLTVEVRRQQALSEFARSALHGSTRSVLLRAATKMVRDSLNIDFCLAFELRESEGALVCLAADGFSGDLRPLRFNPAGETIAARSLRAHEAVSWSYSDGHAPPESAEWLRAHGVITTIGIPIRHGDVSFGAICAYSTTPRRFEGEEVRYLETVANVIAIAADRERAMNEAQIAANRVTDVLESIVEHFVHVDRDWRITFVNVTVPELFHHPAEAIIGQPVTAWFPSFRDPNVMPIYEAAMRLGKPSMFELRSNLNGHYYEARVRPTPEGIGVYFLDITERRVAEEQRLEHERRARKLLLSLPAITWMTDAKLMMLTSVGGGLAKLGLADDELAGRDLRDLFPPGSATIAAHERALRGEASEYQDQFDGRSYHSRVEPVRDNDGNVTGVAGLTVDITDRVVADARLVEAQSIAHFGIWSFDEVTGDRRYSDELLRIFGRTHAEMPPRITEAAYLAHPDDRKMVLSAIRQAINANRPWMVDHRVISADGTVRFVQNAGRCVADASGTPLSGFGSVLDITERKLAEEELVRLANFDVLTGLPNRTQITARIAGVIGDADESARVIAVCCVDVDRFKSINHTLGHAAGDELLRAVGERLGSMVRPGDVVGRLGSDEFVAIFAGVRSDADAGILAAKIRSAFAPPISVLGRDLFVSLSGGMSFYPADGQTPEELLRHADAALYEAKDAGGDRVIAYTPTMNVGSSARLDLQTALHRALDRDEFRLLFQPIVDSSERHVVGCEALLRWAHPSLGMVSPADFIPLAEQTGLIVPIGEWVLREACRSAARWTRADGSGPWVSVNLSARQLDEGGLLDVVRLALSEADLPASRLFLEVTESAIIRDVHGGADVLRELSEMGVGVAIDDFGTGYSSMSYLRSFPFDTLKIDRSFVQGLPANGECGSIARGIIALGHALGMRVVAEGVETEEQAKFLRGESCDKLQGFLISRPVSEDALAELLHRLG